MNVGMYLARSRDIGLFLETSRSRLGLGHQDLDLQALVFSLQHSEKF